jgi:hypothetical protein
VQPHWQRIRQPSDGSNGWVYLGVSASWMAPFTLYLNVIILSFFIGIEIAIGIEIEMNLMPTCSIPIPIAIPKRPLKSIKRFS